MDSERRRRRRRRWNHRSEHYLQKRMFENIFRKKMKRKKLLTLEEPITRRQQSENFSIMVFDNSLKEHVSRLDERFIYCCEISVRNNETRGRAPDRIREFVRIQILTGIWQQKKKKMTFGIIPRRVCTRVVQFPE